MLDLFDYETPEEWKQFHVSYVKKSKALKRYWWISSYGRVKVTFNYKRKEYFPHLGLTGRGYEAISINDAIEKYVHRLVARFFIPNPFNHPVVNHKDLDKTNNHVDNLEWVTHQENARHYHNWKEFIEFLENEED